MWVQGADIKAAEGIKLSQVPNTLTAIVHMEMLSVNMMQPLVSYISVFRLQHSKEFVDALRRNIVDETVLSSKVWTNWRRKFSRYVCFAGTIINNEELLHLITNFEKQGISWNSFGILHLLSLLL